jgi:non-canonical purine NTP pyrophosphatase (RdgB/HAM1 family)
MKARITFITGNAAKARELAQHLDYPVRHKKLDLTEVQSLNLREVVAHKAKEAYRRVGRPVLVEDTSLVFRALGALPGPLIKWFSNELGNRGLCELLNGYKERNALARVCFGLYDGKKLRLFEGAIKGAIAKHPRGRRGFGWDPIFIPRNCRTTWGEMTTGEQKETSMRRIALKKLEAFLR